MFTLCTYLPVDVNMYECFHVPTCSTFQSIHKYTNVSSYINSKPKKTKYTTLLTQTCKYYLYVCLFMCAYIYTSIHLNSHMCIQLSIYVYKICIYTLRTCLSVIYTNLCIQTHLSSLCTHEVCMYMYVHESFEENMANMNFI